MQISSMTNSLMKFLLYARKFFLNKDNLRDIIGAILIFYMINPMFSFYNQLIFIGFCAIWFIIAVLSDKKYIIKILRSKLFLSFCLFPIIAVIYALLDIALLNKHVILLPFILIFVLFYLRKDKVHIIKIYCGLTIIYLFLITCVTLYKFQTVPDLSRLLARGDKNVIKDIITPFTATYATVYCLSIISILIFGIGLNAHNRKQRYLCFGINIYLVYFLFKSAYSISLIIFFLGVIMIVIYKIWSLCSDKKKAIKIFLISIFVVFILYLLTKDFISDAILGLTQYTPDMIQKRRITEIAGLIKNFGFESEGGMLNRFNLYFLSLDTFIKNPIFGVGFRDEILHTTVNVVNPLIGGHSTILDYLASYGVFGFIYIGMIPAFFVKLFNMKLFKNSFLNWIILASFLLLSLINTSLNIAFYFIIMVFIPFMLYYIEDRKII